MKKKPKPPKHLSPQAAELFEDITTDYDFESRHVAILVAALECWDRAREARLLLERDGLVFKDRHGALRPNPCAAIERDAKGLMLRTFRELGLDVETKDENRPPVIAGRRYAEDD